MFSILAKKYEDVFYAKLINKTRGQVQCLDNCQGDGSLDTEADNRFAPNESLQTSRLKKKWPTILAKSPEKEVSREPSP